jgi:hypothetical protein
MGALASSVANIGEGIFKTIDNSNLQHQYQAFKEQLAQQEQVFSNDLKLTAQEQANANSVTGTSNQFYEAINAQSQSQSTKYLIATGVVLTLGVGIILLLKKNKN